MMMFFIIFFVGDRADHLANRFVLTEFRVNELKRMTVASHKMT